MDHAIVLLDNLLRNIQKHDIGLHTCLLSLGHNPEFTVKGSLKVIFGQVLHIGKGQAREATNHPNRIQVTTAASET